MERPAPLQSIYENVGGNPLTPRPATNLFPFVAFSGIDNDLADACLIKWGHWLGGCNRPFGRQSFGLFYFNEIISVAVSASTVNAKCAGFNRQEILELARLCSEPNHRWATRICLRLWRQIAPQTWPHWPVNVLVSYANALRHKGDIYRFDGWQKVAEVKGGKAGGGWNRGKIYEPKSIWIYPLENIS